jgi:hypothetical protein
MDAEPEGQAGQKRNVRTIRVEFGNCDPGQIVYYPNFFMWFDQGTQHLFESVGIHWRDLPRRWGYHAPLVDAQARFLKTVTWGDEIESQVSSTGRPVPSRSDIPCGGRVRLNCWRKGSRCGQWSLPIPENRNK